MFFYLWVEDVISTPPSLWVSLSPLPSIPLTHLFFLHSPLNVFRVRIDQVGGFQDYSDNL